MRDIKFRGKAIWDGTWEYGYFNVAKNGDRIIFVPEVGDRIVAPETVGQYTGIKDKAGKEIYEGDIVRFKGYVGEFYEEGGYTRLTGEVFYKTNGSLDYCIRVEGQGNYGLNTNREYEVIGNIHDNPENEALKKLLDDMYFAYVNKDADNPHQFEVEAVNKYKALKGE